MDVQRKSFAGPTATSPLVQSRKTAVTPYHIYESMPEKEVITVHTGTPKLELKSFPSEQNQVYQGEINLLSVIEDRYFHEFPNIFCNRHFRDTKKTIMCCKYTEDMNDIAAGFTDGTIKLFSCSTGKCTHNLVDDECRAFPGPVTAIKHRPISEAHPITNMLMSSYVNGCVKCWKYKYDQCVYTIREKRQTLGLCYHPHASKFMTYGDDAKLNMYDEEAQTQERAFYASSNIHKVRLDGHTSRIFACAFHPKSNHELISGGWDDTVMCWDDRQPFATKYFCGVHMCGEGLDFNKPGKEILTCSWQDDDNIQIWDYGTCKLIENIYPDNIPSRLYCGKFVPRTNLILCGGSDANILRLIDAKLKVTLSSIKNNPGGVLSFDFGTVRRKKKKNTSKFQLPSDIQSTPRISFVTGKRLQAVDFG